MLKSKIVPSKWIVLSSALCISLGACSSTSGPGAGAGNDAAASGSGGSTAGGSGGSPGAGSGGAGSGSGGSVGNGSGGASASGGSTGSGGTATDGSANTEAGNDATTVPVGTKGVQADPGTDGDGTIPQPPPYPPAPETVARNPGVPVGKVMPYQIYASKSVYPGMKFNYTVYVPAQYQKGKPAAFMVFLDGQHFAGPGPGPTIPTPIPAEDYHWNAPVLYDNLIAAGQLPVTIVAFQDPGTNTGVYRRGDNFHPDAEERSMEYDQPSDGYARFLINEFIPDAITPNWDIVDDPNGWGIGGHSSGGIAAIEACWFRPDKFRKAHSSSASYPNTNNFPGEPTFPSVFNTVKPPKPIRITMLSGTMDDPGWFDANNNAAMVLKANGYHYRYRPGMDNHTPPLAAINEFADAMRWLWRGYTLPWY